MNYKISHVKFKIVNFCCCLKRSQNSNENNCQQFCNYINDYYNFSAKIIYKCKCAKSEFCLKVVHQPNDNVKSCQFYN